MQLKLNHVLIASRRAELTAVRDGFCAASHLQPQLQVLTASDLALVIHGPEHVTASDVLATIRFEEGAFPSECGMQVMLESVIGAMDEPMLRQLLLFVTGESTIPIGGACSINLGASLCVHRVHGSQFWLWHSLTQASETQTFTRPTETVLLSRAIWEEKTRYQLHTCVHIRWTFRCTPVNSCYPRSCTQRWNYSKVKGSRLLDTLRRSGHGVLLFDEGRVALRRRVDG